MNPPWQGWGLCLLWLALPFACQEEPEEPPWAPIPNGHDSGVLRWVPRAKSDTIAAGQRVGVEVSLLFRRTTCTGGGSGCAEESSCGTADHWAAIEPVDVDCTGAGCSIESVSKTEVGLELLVTATDTGRVKLDVTVEDQQTHETYQGAAHLDFFVPERLSLLRTPIAMPAESTAILPGTELWVCPAVFRRDVPDFPLWAEQPAPELATSGPVSTLPPPLRVDFDPEAAGTFAPTIFCHRLTALEPGTIELVSKLGDLEAQASYHVVSPDEVTGLEVRRVEALGSAPLWLPLDEEADEVLSEPVEALEIAQGAAELNPFLSTLELSGGIPAWGGVGAMTVGPSGVAVLKDAHVSASSQGLLTHSEGPTSSQPLARSLFLVDGVSQGDATLRFELGTLRTELPIHVGPPD